MTKKVLATNISGIKDETVQRAFRQVERIVNDLAEDINGSDGLGGVVTSVTGTGAASVTPSIGAVVVDVDLSGYALNGHTHVESDVTNLVADLANKSPVGHGHNVFNNTTNGFVPAPNNGSDPAKYLTAAGTWTDPSAAIDALFGTGDDGDVTISVDTTLSRDMAYNNLTVNVGKELNTGGFRIFVKGVLTLNGKIVRNGNPGADAPPSPDNAGGGGGAALAAGSLPGSSTGGAGGATAGGATGTGGTSLSRYAGLGTGAPAGLGGKCQGGAGGANSGGTAGGAGGNCTEASATVGNMLYTVFQSITGRALTGDQFSGASGAGGGRGGPGAGEGGGGGGGSGGGYIVVCAKACAVGGGIIEAKGGAGGAGGPSVAHRGGGGGGGGGGTVILVVATGAFPGCSVVAGVGGLPSPGGGAVGYDGGSGHIERYRVLAGAGGGAGAVFDGNYSDITVSGTGSTWDINAGAVGTTEIAASAVTSAKLAALSVTTAKIDNLAVDASKIATDAVTTSKILANNVTIEKLAQMATARFLGRTTAATGNVETLTGTQATAMLDVVTTSVKGLVPTLPNDATKYLNGVGAWAVVSGGAAGGLFAPTLGTAPTSASTGLNAWLNQPASSTVTDAANGIVVFGPNQSSTDNQPLRYRAVPAEPYTITALVAGVSDFGTNTALQLGFADGSTAGAKRECWVYRPFISGTDSLAIVKFTGSQPATFDGYVRQTTLNQSLGTYLWLRMVVDSTTVKYQFSPTGDMWITYTTVTKATGHLGSSGYVNIFFGCGCYSGDMHSQLLSWTIT